MADQSSQIVRLAKLRIAAAHIPAYTSALREEIAASLRHEPGVLSLTAMAEKDNPTRITIVETYADNAAYQAHLQSPHFLTYKAATQTMVMSLELVEMTAL